jgi:starch synthase
MPHALPDIELLHGDRNPVVAILPWGDVVEDYIDAIGLSLDDYAERLSGGWLFGFAEAFHRTGIDTVIICWSRDVKRPTRRTHAPTGSTLWFLPPSRTYRAARAWLRDPYAWDRRSASGEQHGVAAAAAAVARVAAPYLTATPVALAGVLRQEGCRAVLCQEYEEGRFDVCVVLGRLLRLPVFATFQGGDRTRTKLERALRPLVARAATGFIVSAEDEVERLRRRYGVPAHRIARIPNPLDLSTVRQSPRQTARAKLGIHPDARVAVWHGRVEIDRKGIDTLVDAWCQVRATARSHPILLLLGTGSGADWLQKRIDGLALDDVRWTNEYVLDRDVIGAHLSAADVFVLPSRQEGFPVAPVEAMAAGLPVVATDAPGVRAVLGAGDAAAGVVVPRGDADALARELRRFLDDTELCVELGARGIRRVDEEFSLEAVGAQLRAFVLKS